MMARFRFIIILLIASAIPMSSQADDPALGSSLNVEALKRAERLLELQLDAATSIVKMASNRTREIDTELLETLQSSIAESNASLENIYGESFSNLRGLETGSSTPEAQHLINSILAKVDELKAINTTLELVKIRGHTALTTIISPDHSPVNLPVKKGEISSPLTAQECKSDNQSLELLKKTYLIICYNKGWKIPLWVGYELTKSQIEGNVRRTNDFRPDPALDDQFTAKLKDYKGSDFDRGHMAPAAAFKADQVGMSGTFLLSNIAPQTPALNRIAWRKLEAEVRTLVHDRNRKLNT